MSMPAESAKLQANLQQLLQGFAEAPALAVKDIASDSRQLSSGDVFLAVQGATSHGLDYADQALAAGVAAIVWDQDTGHVNQVQTTVPMIPVAGLAGHLGEIANRWFEYPSARLKVVGVTGTNGKTTVAFLIAQCLNFLERRAAYVGTLGAATDDLDASAGMTTPACVDLHRRLAQFVDTGATHVALEVSSHGIEQSRVDGVAFDAAIFTNLSRDHIDYHGDMQAYAESKARLFLENELQHRVINVDDEFGQVLAARCSENVVRVSGGTDFAADGRLFLSVISATANAHGMQVAIESSWGDAQLQLPLVGDFNVVNAACVLALLLCWEITLPDACRALTEVAAPPGRMQRVTSSSGPATYVDYAHTPGGLEAALEALRLHTEGQLWCVFGCGGDRDQGKRPMMGQTAARLADRPIVTSDNPRSEPPGKIIAEILAGMPDDTKAIEDRASAIAYAIAQAADDDLVLIAGKGHETHQQIGRQRLPFSDYQVARAILEAGSADSDSQT